ncbi:unnamed protein product [Lota lota]
MWRGLFELDRPSALRYMSWHRINALLAQSGRRAGCQGRVGPGSGGGAGPNPARPDGLLLRVVFALAPRPAPPQAQRKRPGPQRKCRALLCSNEGPWIKRIAL